MWHKITLFGALRWSDHAHNYQCHSIKSAHLRCHLSCCWQVNTNYGPTQSACMQAMHFVLWMKKNGPEWQWYSVKKSSARSVVTFLKEVFVKVTELVCMSDSFSHARVHWLKPHWSYCCGKGMFHYESEVHFTFKLDTEQDFHGASHGQTPASDTYNEPLPDLNV